MEHSIQLFAAINFFVIGLSHVIQHRAWAEFFILMHSKGKAGALANGFLHIMMGTLIVSFHNVWSGIPIILTLMGWGYVLKSAAIFIFPDYGLKSIGRVTLENSHRFRIAGVLMIIVSGLLGYELWLS